MESRKSLCARFRITASVGLMFLLGACTTGPGEIFRLFDLGGKSVSIGSRQRLVINTEPEAMPRPGLVQPKRIVCAEPSPDVAATVANSFGIGVSIFGQGSGSLTGAQAEGIIQLAERTATIQLLRDQMYRACEAYANGAITGTTYSLITSKNNKTMVSLLLGETAGGAVGRSLGAIGTGASAKASAAFQGLSKNSAAREKAAKDLTEAKAELEAAEEAKKNAKTKEENDSADAKVKAAKEKMKLADQRHQDSSEATSQSMAEVRRMIAGGGIDINESAELADVLKGMQKQFLESNFVEDFVSACLVELGLNPNPEGINTDALRSAETRVNQAALDLKDKPLDKGLQVDYQRAIKRLETAFIRNNNTYLSKFCNIRLPDVLKASWEDRFKLQDKKLDIELASVRVNAVGNLGHALAQCVKFSDPKQKEYCQTAAVAIATGKPVPMPVPIIITTPAPRPEPETPKKPKIVKPMDAVGKLQDLLPSFEIKRGKIDAAIAEAVKDDLKDDKAKLETAQTKLKKLTDPLAGKVTEALKTTKTEKVSELQQSRAELLAKLESTDSAKADERAIIKNKLAGQQLQAKIISKEYNALAAKVTAALPKMDKQIADIGKYTKANVN